MPPEDNPAVRPDTIKKFLKDRTSKRVGVEAKLLLTNLLVTIAEHVAPKAEESVIKEHRSTILARDIQWAYDDFMVTKGPDLLSTQAVHDIIDGLSNEGLTALINSLRADLEGQP